MSDLPNTILDIYQRASAAYNVAPEGEKDGVLDAFIGELNAMDFSIGFSEAADLDEEYFGVWGNYWATAFGYPKVGDEVNTTYGTENWTFEVTHRGLLTLIMEVVDRDD